MSIQDCNLGLIICQLCVFEQVIIFNFLVTLFSFVICGEGDNELVTLPALPFVFSTHLPLKQNKLSP